MIIRLLIYAGLCLAASSLLANDALAPVPVEAQSEVIVLEESPPGDDASEEEKASYWERVRQQYEAAKSKSQELMNKTKDATGDIYGKAKEATGDAYQKTKEVAGDAYEATRDTTVGWYEGTRDWTQDDLKKAGAWHYRVLVISKHDISREPQKVERMLNQMGSERFECYWVEPLDDDNGRIAFFFKKSGVSMLKSIPAKEFWRFIPMGSDQDTPSQ